MKSRLRAALWSRLRTGKSAIPAVSLNLVSTGVARPYPDVNRIYFIWTGRAHGHQQGWGPCSGLLSQLLLGARVITILILNAKVVGMVPTSGCPMHRASRRY